MYGVWVAQAPALRASADARLVDADQASPVLSRQRRYFGSRPGARGAVDHNKSEAVSRQALLAQSVEAVTDVAWAVLSADADGQVHAQQPTEHWLPDD